MDSTTTTPVSSQGNCSMMTVKGAISALRRACLITTAPKLSPLSRAVRMYCRHDLRHRGARHARDVADSIDGHGHYGQGEIGEGEAFRHGRRRGAIEQTEPRR